jgi:hypothetical protein
VDTAKANPFVLIRVNRKYRLPVPGDVHEFAMRLRRFERAFASS